MGTHFLRVLCTVAILLMSPSVLPAAVINFDDLSSNDGVYIPQDYKGFSWLGAVGTQSWVNNSAVPLGALNAHSGTNYAWSNGGSRLDLLDDSFNIEGLWIRSLYGASPTPAVTYTGKLAGNTLFTFTQSATYDWTYVSLNFNGIDELTFVGSPNTNLIVDDITYTKAVGGEVPEPTTLIIWSLLGTVAIGLGWWRKRKVA